VLDILAKLCVILAYRFCFLGGHLILLTSFLVQVGADGVEVVR
jgi:hypothetical protein